MSETPQDVDSGPGRALAHDHPKSVDLYARRAGQPAGTLANYRRLHAELVQTATAAYVAIDGAAGRYAFGDDPRAAEHAYRAAHGDAALASFLIYDVRCFSPSGSPPDPRYGPGTMEQAERHFAALRDVLKAWPGQYARVDIDTGDYSVGPSRTLASARFRAAYGDRVGYTFQIMDW